MNERTERTIEKDEAASLVAKILGISESQVIGEFAVAAHVINPDGSIDLRSTHGPS